MGAKTILCSSFIGGTIGALSLDLRGENPSLPSLVIIGDDIVCRLLKLSCEVKTHNLDGLIKLQSFLCTVVIMEV
jgi:hypothetical protein